MQSYTQYRCKQKKTPILRWETAPQQLGLVFDPTLEAHPIGRKSSSPPKCQRKRGTIFEPEVVVVILWHIYLGSNDVVDMLKNPMDNIPCLKVSHPFVAMGEKKVSCINRVQQVDAPSRKVRQVLSFTAGPCFFSLCFLRDSLCYVH